MFEFLGIILLLVIVSGVFAFGLAALYSRSREHEKPEGIADSSGGISAGWTGPI